MVATALWCSGYIQFTTFWLYWVFTITILSRIDIHPLNQPQKNHQFHTKFTYSTKLNEWSQFINSHWSLSIITDNRRCIRVTKNESERVRLSNNKNWVKNANSLKILITENYVDKIFNSLMQSWINNATFKLNFD